jgi:hypothetical protein
LIYLQNIIIINISNRIEYRMFFLIADYCTKLAVNIALTMGATLVYRSVSGVYYGTKYILNRRASNQIEKEMSELTEDPCIILTKEEYERLLNYNTRIDEISRKLECID